jgi:hypothetical protein
MKTISRYIMTLALLLTAATGAWAEDTYTITFKANGNTKTVENVTLPHTFELDPIIRELYPSLSGGSGSPAGTSASGNTNVTAYHNNSKHYATISAPFEGVVTVTGQFFKDFTNYQYTLEINCMENLVAISDDKTEATIKMPTYDVNVNYELVRDMSVQMQAQVGDDPDKQPRYRVKKEDNVFKPADLSLAQVMALFSVNDQIEQKVLTPTTDYIVNIYAIDEEGQPTGNPMTFADFTFEPGIYAVKAVAAEGSPYDGESALSNKFVLFQGYEVYVPAGEYVTYYRNEALRVDEADKENFKLYTVSSVSGDKATLSNAFDAAPSNTPFLVYNNTNESKTVLLIPCNEPNLALTVADQFLGTMEEKTFTDADMAAADYYVCNGKQFVKVRGAGTLGANKAYLKFVTDQQQSAPQYISISGDLGEGTTSIDNLNVNDNLNDNEATWYDLNGRKLNGKPAQKGIYIKNGKKIVVK